MRRPFAIAALSAAFTLNAPTSYAGAREDLTNFSRGLRTLQAPFQQTLVDSKGRVKQRSSGKVAAQLPRQFRWEYDAPYRQLVVADGRVIWVYEPDLQQASRRPQDREEQSSPLALVLEPERLDRAYTLSDAGTSNGLNWLRLVPKQKAQSNFDNAQIGFRAGQPVQLIVTDPLGNRTQMSFGAWTRNASLPVSTFQFSPPKGVDVIGD